MSERPCDYRLVEPLSMDNPLDIILEQQMGGQCDCWNPVYNESDNDCSRCAGGGVVMKRNQVLMKATLKTAGQIADEGDPIVYACMYKREIETGDVIVCKGVRYIIIDVGAGFTPNGKEIIICGLDYERNHDHSKAILKRYK